MGESSDVYSFTERTVVLLTQGMFFFSFQLLMTGVYPPCVHQLCAVSSCCRRWLKCVGSSGELSARIPLPVHLISYFSFSSPAFSSCSFIFSLASSSQTQGSSYFCERVHVCPETSALTVNALEQNRDNTKCDFCINVVNSLKEIVASPETENEFKECLGNACLHIGALKDEVSRMREEGREK